MAQQNVLNFHSEFDNLRNEVELFAARLQSQIAEDEGILRQTAADRNVANDAAFEGLDVFVGQLVAIADGEEAVGKDALPYLPVVVDLFHKLSKTCESAVDRMGTEFVDTTQYGGEVRQLQDKIQALIDSIDGDLRAEDGALGRARTRTKECEDSLSTAKDQLSDAKDKRDGWYDVSSFFGGGGDIDSQVRTNERNVDSCEDTARDARSFQNIRESVVNQLNKLKPRVEESKRRLEELFWAMNTEHEKIVKGRRIDERTWVATRALDYHICTNDVDTSRDDILRHVLKLVHTRVEQVDEDVDVQRFKEKIERRILAALGQNKVDELMREKQYLSMDDANF